MKIEKNIHQIWIGPHQFPERERAFCELFQGLNPDFAYFLWTDGNLPDMPLNIYSIFDEKRKKNPALAADILRIFIVYKFGGYYFDVDCEPLLPLRHLKFLDEADVWMTSKGPKAKFVPNSNFGGIKGHSLFSFMLRTLEHSEWHGPSWFCGRIQEWLGIPRDSEVNNNDLVTAALPHNIVFSEFGPESGFRHHALASWLPEYRRRNGYI